MEKNGVSKAKKVKSISLKKAKKERKAAKKAAKKQEKRERKDIKAAYTKALKKQGADKMLAIVAILLTLAPVVAQFIVDKKEENNKN
ncbi:MAG: hypothetical protein K6E10_08755 [Eubacterium sp.]|nr:hypothetical protein [Eubacterium sp.]